MTVTAARPLAVKKKKKLLTAEELFEMGDIGPCELVEGEVIEMAPTGGRHGHIVIRLGGILDTFVRTHKLGRVYGGETGFIVRRDPDTVRAADVMFVASGRLARVDDVGFLPIVPDLAAEIISPGDRWSEIEAKVGEYLATGVRLVWVVDPGNETVHVYRPDRDIRRLSRGDTLDGGDVLPGFTLPVDEIFEV